jgi:hypothetical protein
MVHNFKYLTVQKCRKGLLVLNDKAYSSNEKTTEFWACQYNFWPFWNIQSWVKKNLFYKNIKIVLYCIFFVLLLAFVTSTLTFFQLIRENTKKTSSEYSTAIFIASLLYAIFHSSINQVQRILLSLFKFSIEINCESIEMINSRQKLTGKVIVVLQPTEISFKLV